MHLPRSRVLNLTSRRRWFWPSVCLGLGYTHAQGDEATTIPVGNKPHFCCFDGQNMWVNDDATGVNVVYKNPRQR